MPSLRASLFRRLLTQVFIGMLILSGLSYWSLTHALEGYPEAAWQATFPILIVMPLLGIVLFFSISKLLAPLKGALKAQDLKSPLSLKPISLDSLPEEFSPLASAFNFILKEHQDAILREKRYRSENSHKLRGELAILKIHAFNASHLEEPGAKEASLNKLIRGIDRSTRLVEQLRNEVEMEDRLKQIEQTEVDLKELARKTLLEMAPLALKKNHDLSFDAEGEGYLIKGEAASLSLLMNNLIHNAIQAMKPGGSLGICLEEASSKIMLKVTDRGCGIPSALRADVFKRFCRLKGQGKTGAGLGLSMAKRVADAHGAEITLRDNPRHGGLLVSVSFPKL